jgi:hypothetical protein
MNIDKAQLIPFLKGLAEGYSTHNHFEYTGEQIAATLESAVERIEAGEFDEVAEDTDNWSKEWDERYGGNNG